MKKIVTSEQMKNLDRFTITKIGVPSLVLMERAALSVVEELKKSDFSLEHVLIVCGTGNNGGDGVAIARVLHLEGYRVSVCLVGEEQHQTEEMRTQIAIAKNYKVSFVNNPAWCEYTTIVDAIFGIGLSREIKETYKEVIESINHASAKVMAVDIPSGIHGNLGYPMGIAVEAYQTVSFAYYKPGLLLYPGASYAGKVTVADIGIRMPGKQGKRHIMYCLDKKDISLIPKRKHDGNKGTFGKVFLIAGNYNMSGAAYLCASACIHTGAGMVKVHTRQENREIMQLQLPEAMLSTYEENDWNKEQVQAGMRWADVIAIGPGMGTSPQAHEMLLYVVTKAENPLIIDADGLNLLSTMPGILKKCKVPCILTPHLGEMARLAGESVESLKTAFVEKIEAFAADYRVVCVCKDARTIIAVPMGTTYINLSGNEGMATAGSGDVLTGIIAGLMAQGMDPALAAACGTYLHGAAGDLAKKKKGSYSMIACDLIEQLGEVLKEKD